MKSEEIGGYFELELPDKGGFLHDDGVLLNSGRTALEYVLRALGDVSHILIPYYTCNVVLEPIQNLNIPYMFYHIDQNLELDELPLLRKDEYLIYTNYFGIKDEYVKKLADCYGSQLIVDNSQAWFAEPIDGISTFYSPRKYIGVPDGGIVYCTKEIDVGQIKQDNSYDRCSHLLKRIDLGPSDGYADYKANNRKLVGESIKRMSKLTYRLLCSIDFEFVKIKRRANFEYLHDYLKETNLFSIPSLESFECPMVYPYLTDDSLLRQHLINHKIFVATYWPNVLEWCSDTVLEYRFANLVLPLPCDHRYSCNDIQRIIQFVMR